MSEYAEVFCGKGEPLGECKVGECYIDTGDHPPIKHRPYRLPLAK